MSSPSTAVADESPVVESRAASPVLELPAAPADLAGADRRVHRRHASSDIPFITRVRLRFGPKIGLVDLSSGGAQIETIAFRLQPGTSVVIELLTDDQEIAVAATVLRCQLASLLPEPVYRGALVFKEKLDLEVLGPLPSEPELEPELNPALEQTRLRQVLLRLSVDGRSPGRGDGSASDSESLVAALHAAVAVLDTPAGMRAGPVLASELAALLKAMTDALNRRTKPTALIAALEDHLRRVIPARAVRLDETNSFLQLPGSEAILFSIPSLDPATPPGRVVVEFAQDSEPLEWHMQLLKSTLQLVALVRELARRAGDVPLALAAEQRLPPGWCRVVARYVQGQMIKGFTQHFLAANGSLVVSPTPGARADGRITVPFRDLKAIFFVRDLQGSPGYQESKAVDLATRGRKVSVTFVDGEELVGTTVNYMREAPGFFVHPADPKSNNERVFVLGTAVRDVKFL